MFFMDTPPKKIVPTDEPPPQKAGRPKGALNKSTHELREAVSVHCLGFDPVVAMAKVAMNGLMAWTDPVTKKVTMRQVSEAHRIKCLQSVAEYLHRKLTAVQFDPNLEEGDDNMLPVKIEMAIVDCRKETRDANNT
jgi:hypothetical protein